MSTSQAMAVSAPDGAGTAPALDLEASARTFIDDGYVVLPRVVSEDKVRKLGDEVVSEFERQRSEGLMFSGGGLFAGHLNCYPGEGARSIYDDLVERGAIDLVRKLSSTQVDALRIGLNLNLPNSVAQNYHIDGSFGAAFLIVNVAVVDTDLVNGAIDLVPRTHAQPYPYWQFAARRVYRASTRVTMKRGDVLVRSSALWHRGMPNKSAVPRPMLALTFGESGAPSSDPLREHGGRIVFETNRFRTDFLGQLRERSYVVMPLAHSAFRFVRSLLGKDGYMA